MKQKKKWGKKNISILLICCMVFGISVAFIFSMQYQRLNREFDQLVYDNLSAFTLSQRQQTGSLVENAQSTLTALSETIEQTGLSPEGEWLDVYLEKISGNHGMQQIQYLTAAGLREAAGPGEGDEAVCDALLQGQGIVSDIYNSQRMGGIDCFVIAEPVTRDGSVIGALLAAMDVSVITDSVRQPEFFQKITSLIVTEDGTIKYTNNRKSKYMSDGYLFSSMQHNGINGNIIAGITARFEEEKSLILQFQAKGNDYFLSAEELGYNGWYMINFVRSPDLLIRSESIASSVIWSGMALIAITALAGGIILLLLLRQKRLLHMEMQKYAVLSQFSDTILFEYDCKTDVLEFTSNARERLSLASLRLDNILAEHTVLKLLHPDDENTLRRIFQSPTGREEISHAEGRLKILDGTYSWFGCQYKYVFDAEGRPAKVIGKIVDITKQRGREQTLLEKAQRDVLTGVYNKAGEQMIDRILQENPRGFFLMLDIDYFKEINDTCGHIVGDTILSEVGAILKTALRAQDIAMRVGGDEFAIFLPGSQEEAEAAQCAELVLGRINTLKAEERIPVTASIGISSAPKDGSAYKDLYAAADKALYSVKQNARGKISFYR